MKIAIKSAALAAVLFASTFASSHAEEGSKMTVYKTPWCGCCEVWTEAMTKAGFNVEIRDLENLDMTKRQAGVPDDLAACHTATLGKYVIEGHVPLEAIQKLLEEKPAIRGIAVAGMPQGSLGMGFDPAARYDVMSFTYAKLEKPQVFYKAGL